MIFTNMNRYTAVHEAFNPITLSNLYLNYGISTFAVVLDDGNYPNLPGIKYCSKEDNVKEEFSNYVKKVNPKKICNFIDYLTQWELIDWEGETVYFVRSLYAANKNTEKKLSKWKKRELERLYLADIIVTDSPNSQKVLRKHYRMDSYLCWEYVNPIKYLDIPIQTDLDHYYIIGRHDKEKRFDMINKRHHTKMTVIGDKELSNNSYVNFKSLGLMPFEKYIKYIKSATFGIFPSYWESNGYTVQECLAMGKIPIVQFGSGGNERLCNTSNSITIDFDNQGWFKKPENVREMQQNAKSTLTYNMYKNSLEKFVEIMYS